MIMSHSRFLLKSLKGDFDKTSKNPTLDYLLFCYKTLQNHNHICNEVYNKYYYIFSIWFSSISTSSIRPNTSSFILALP